jgi:Arc/MetJ-type ribon-helix-helix transcriptional regulator
MTDAAASVQSSARLLEDPVRVTVRVGREQVSAIEALVGDNIYPDRSKAIRDAVDCLLDADDLPADDSGAAERVTIRLPEYQDEGLERLQDEGHYGNRSVAVRAGVSRLLSQLEAEGVLER